MAMFSSRLKPVLKRCLSRLDGQAHR